MSHETQTVIEMSEGKSYMDPSQFLFLVLWNCNIDTTIFFAPCFCFSVLLLSYTTHRCHSNNLQSSLSSYLRAYSMNHQNQCRFYWVEIRGKDIGLEILNYMWFVWRIQILKHMWFVDFHQSKVDSNLSI